jgi:hypothetical protein
MSASLSPVSSSTPQHPRRFALLDLTSRASFRAVRSYALVLVSLSLLAACSGTSVGGGVPGGGTGDETGRASSPEDSTTTPGSSEGENGSDDYDALFGPPKTSERTSGVLEGLWAGTAHGGDVRLVISDRSVTVALRCIGGETLGLEVAARVGPASLQLLESKEVGESWSSCSISVTPVEIPDCESDSRGGCYLLEGMKLWIQGIALFSSGGSYSGMEFTKLSD